LFGISSFDLSVCFEFRASDFEFLGKAGRQYKASAVASQQLGERSAVVAMGQELGFPRVRIAGFWDLVE
jgi:hypothetical protein